MIVANFPIEIIFEIFKKCDYVTCLKLIKVFEKRYMIINYNIRI